MAQIELRLSSKVQKITGRSEVLIRLYQGSKLDIYGKSGIFISPAYFEYYVNREQTRKNGVTVPDKVQTSTAEAAINKGYVLRRSGEIIIRGRVETQEVKYHHSQAKRINELVQFISNRYEQADKDTITSEWLTTWIDEYHNPDKYLSKEEQARRRTFFDLLEDYLKDTKYSAVRENTFRVLIRALKRYEMFIRLSDRTQREFTLDINTMDKDRITDFESFFRNEHALLEEYPDVFKQIPATIDTKRRSPKPQPRGHNTICAQLKRLRAFCNWCNNQGITANKPFAGYNGVTTEIYGTPYYISIDERNHIADFDLSAFPHLAAQRDIFIFQCLIGCRISDLMKLKESDIINGEITYMPEKTKEERQTLVRVPLNERALSLIGKYRGMDKQCRLFPFISSQKYNDAIKEIFTRCGVTRPVSVLNPVTGDEEKKPINEVASSHIARRTFVGNLYKKVRDPNLVGALSGHVEGSKAFARYREIDVEIRKDVIKLID
jgi:integrase